MDEQPTKTARPFPRASLSLDVYAALIAMMGTVLMVAPRQVGLVGADGLVRSMAALLLVLAGYYRVAARHGFRPFIVATIWGRFAIAGFQVAAILAGWLEAPSWGGAGLDLTSAAWTLWALRADERASR